MYILIPSFIICAASLVWAIVELVEMISCPKKKIYKREERDLI